MRRPSSRPEITSTIHPVSAFTQAWNAAALRASRMAEVATTRIWSGACACTARWKRLRARSVAAMASGEIKPDSKTLEPRRVTSRSSCSVFNWCATTRAILSRHELEPTSMAAKVGMGPRYTTAMARIFKRDEELGPRLLRAAGRHRSSGGDRHAGPACRPDPLRYENSTRAEAKRRGKRIGEEARRQDQYRSRR